MIHYKYIPVKSIYCNDEDFIRYGIAAIDTTDDPPTVIYTAADLAGNSIKTRKLAEKCNREKLSIDKLEAVIEDFLSDND